MTENQLRHETSPYLLQHRDNPVHWRPWGAAAFEESRATGKPVLLSIGYAACHWCHVMAHESFENPRIAELMNDLFVSIKVDREERPDVDTIYQHALTLLGQQGGWPLTMFLTADGEPFWGGTYFPPESRWGRPGFPDVLRAIAAAWRDDPEKISGNVRAMREALARMADPKSGGPVPVELLDRVAERLVREVDPFHGGIGEAPKFPHVPVFALLWRAWKRSGDEIYLRAVKSTLTHMSQGGIYDHLGGGFARYSTDQRWLAPHFEKMLYDNAQLLELLAAVWQDTRSPLFEQRVRETIGWLEREMIAPAEDDGLVAFAATLDADSEGEEGRFYVWSAAEIDRVLEDRAEEFKRFYDVGPAGNWEGKTILNRLATPDLADAATEARLAEARRRLLAARKGRIRPERDDKVLADWNGLMIAALAFCGGAFGEPAWIASAAGAFAYVRRHMTTEDGRLRHSRRLGRLRHPATLDDYASMIRAAVALAEATGERDYIDQAIAWSGIVDRHYADPAGPGYFVNADDADLLITRPRTASDGAVPAGNAMLAEAFARLHLLTGDPVWRDRAETLVIAFSGDIERNFFPLATLLNASETLRKGLQIAIVGEPGATDTAALLAAVHAQSLPDAVITRLAPGTSLPPTHPAAGKTAVDGRATAYVCEGSVCSLPVTDPAILAVDLGTRYRGSPRPGSTR